MGETGMRSIEYYYDGARIVVRCDELSHFEREDTSVSGALLIGDIRRGLLIDTENGYVRPMLYTHKGLLDTGYLFNCIADLADAKLAAIMVTGFPVKSDVEKMYGDDLPHEVCEASCRD